MLPNSGSVHVPPLRRVLGTWAVVAFGVTNEIAAGLFFVSTQIQQTVPGVGDLVPWLMLAGGAITLLTVVAYRYFFASGLVGAGGEYVILRDVLGARWGFFATLLAWILAAFLVRGLRPRAASCLIASLRLRLHSCTIGAAPVSMAAITLNAHANSST